ncbi:MAG: hypothetical protein DRJ03_19415 [Chloroflexi bacterium]|nr:MAG: hypothetical protein DRJ03_19415 [Chloroflexota bacterium]
MSEEALLKQGIAAARAGRKTEAWRLLAQAPSHLTSIEQVLLSSAAQLAIRARIDTIEPDQ